MKDFSTKKTNNCKIEHKSVIVNEGSTNQRVEYFYTWGKFISQAWSKPSYRNTAAKKHQVRGLSAFLQG